MYNFTIYKIKHRAFFRTLVCLVSLFRWVVTFYFILLALDLHGIHMNPSLTKQNNAEASLIHVSSLLHLPTQVTWFSIFGSYLSFSSRIPGLLEFLYKIVRPMCPSVYYLKKEQTQFSDNNFHTRKFCDSKARMLSHMSGSLYPNTIIVRLLNGLTW